MSSKSKSISTSTAGKSKRKAKANSIAGKAKAITGKGKGKDNPVKRLNPPCSDDSLCNSHWCKDAIIDDFSELKGKIIGKYTDIVTVGPAGFKPLHDGHLLVIEKAFIEAQKIKYTFPNKKILVLINTSCSDRLKGSGFKIPRGKMYELWETFINPILDSYKTRYGVDYETSFNNNTTLYWLNTLPKMNIHAVYSQDGEKDIKRIFKGREKSGTLTNIPVVREVDGVLSGTKAREYLDKKDLKHFLTLTNKFINPEGYFKALISGGGRKAKPAKRKVKSALKPAKPAKRKVKSALKQAKPAKRKAKSALKQAKPAKRKSKSALKPAKPAKRKAKSAQSKIKSSNNSNIVLKRGYCEATILDENEHDDPCYIHTSENECLNETRDSDYWRSYDCKWKN